MSIHDRLDAIERRVGLGKFAPARELNRRQIREAHGKRVEARQKEREPVCKCEDPNTCQSCPDH